MDEERRCPANLARIEAALDVSADAREDRLARPILVEALPIQAEITCVAAEVFVLERVLPMEEAFVHVPESILARRCLGCGCGSQGVRMDLGQGEVPEDKANAAFEPPLHALDLPESLPGVGALVVAVFNEERSSLGSADVVDQRVDCLVG